MIVDSGKVCDARERERKKRLVCTWAHVGTCKTADANLRHWLSLHRWQDLPGIFLLLSHRLAITAKIAIPVSEVTGYICYRNYK